MKSSAKASRHIQVFTALLTLSWLAGLAGAATLEVSQPVQVTNDAYYERGQSIVYDGANYWLFYGRSAAEQGWYQNGNPDVHDYEVYYKTAVSVAGLPAATATKITAPGNANSYLGETGTAYFGGEVWAFSTIDLITQADVYGWYHDGSNWNEVTSLVTGLSTGSAHHDETVFGGELFIVVRRSDDFYTTHSATPKSGGWSSEVAVGSAGGLCHFFRDGGDLYLAVLKSPTPRENQIFRYESGTDSWTLVASASSDGWDPTLFKVGSDYVFSQAPWTSDGGGRQYLIQWASSALDANFFVNGSTMAVEGRYDTNTWVDMWPIGFTDAGGTSYLFYTSERDEPDQEGTGNIWYLEVSWDVYGEHYTYIKEAVTAASDGDAIDVAAGSYREQITIDKSLDLTGAGIGNSIIEAPDPADRTTYQITQWTGSVRDIDAIVGVTGAGTVNITGFTVDGRETGPDNFYGLHFFDTSGSVTFCRIEDVLDAGNPGGQRVVSLAATQSAGTPFTIDFSDNVIPNFQKGGILIMGPDGAFTVERNQITNAPSDYNAGNGIQLSYGATGSTSQNVVQGVAFTGEDWAATGILLFECGDVTLAGDEVHGCQSAVNFSDWGWVYSHPAPVNLSFSSLNLYDNEWTLGAQLSRDNSDPNLTITDCIITGSTGDGIDIFGTGIDPWGGIYYLGWDNGDLNAVITGCTIDNTTGYDGIWTDDSSGNLTNNSSIAVHNTTFSNNTSSAVNHNLPETMDASACYWNDPAGPVPGVKALTVLAVGRPLISPFGKDLPRKGHVFTREVPADKTGETIYGPVDYSPWLGSLPGSVPMDWHTNDSIQEAVDLAQPGDSIDAMAGHYEEQLYIDKASLTITGVGAGATFLDAPATLPLSFFALGNDNYPVVWVDGVSSVHFADLTLDGLGRGNSHNWFMGFAFYNATGSLTDVHVTNVRETPFSAVYHGTGFFGYHDVPGGYAISLTDVSFDQFQLEAIACSGPDLTLDLTRVQMTGAGPTDLVAQIGLDLNGDAHCTATDCTIADISYSVDPWVASGLLIYDSATLDVSGSSFDGCQSAISFFNGSGVCDGITVTNPTENGVYAFHDGGKASGAPGRHFNLPWKVAGRDKAPVTVSVTNSVLTGNNTADSYGLWAEGTGSVQLVASNCAVTHWDQGLHLEEFGGTVGGEAHNCVIRDNVTYGGWSNTITPYDATGNWWGGATGPFHPTLNPTGLGNEVSDNILFDPFRDGNVVFVPDPQMIGLDDDAGGGYYRDQVVCHYLGGGSGPVYGYSIDVTWDPLVIAASPGDFARPDTGPFATATFFFVQAIPNGVRIDAALGGAEPGSLADDLFQGSFTAVGTPDHATSDLTLALNDFRDPANQPLTGFTPDHGLMIVDLVGPAFTSVLVTNTTLAHTDDFFKDGDDLLLTAAVADGDPDFGATNITADLTGLGGGAAVNPDSYDGATATWSLPGVTGTPSDGVVTVAVTAADPAGNVSGASDDIIADNTAPTPLTGLAATPGHKKVDLSWDDPTGNDTYFDGLVIRYAAWGDYPIYAPPEPDYPADQTAGDGEAFDGAGTSATHAFVDDDRDIYYYAGFVYDVARNYSPVEGGGGHQARSTNYWLGDVSDGIYGQYDGFVDVADVTALGSTYNLYRGDPGFKDEVDIGPTHDDSRLGIPIPDGYIGFDDLMIMAMNFGIVTPLHIPPTGSQLPQLAWVQEDARTWSLQLLEPCSNLKGVRLRAQLPSGVTVTVAAGDLLAEQPSLVFLRNAGPHDLDIGLAIMGTGVGFVGSGELYVVTLSTAAELRGLEIEARGLDNESFEIDPEVTAGEDIPSVFEVAQNFPNPFNPMTTIKFGLPADQPVRLTIFTLDGKRVVTLVDEEFPSGRHEVIWNGRDETGRAVASGTYIYRIVAGPHLKSQKMVLMK